MQIDEFRKLTSEHPRPLLIEFQATWCAPCRQMKPLLNKAAEKYIGEVDVMEIDADASPEVLQSLGVYGIPTVIGFSGGREVLRRTGMQSQPALEALLEGLKTGETPKVTLRPMDRMLRGALGLAVMLLGGFSWPQVLLVALGAVIMFSAVYDRCPIYNAIAPRVAALFKRSAS